MHSSTNACNGIHMCFCVCMTSNLFLNILQLISNNIFKSVEHRVLANHNKCPRISVACFFALDFHPTRRMYGPIKELLSKDNPAIYKEITLKEFATYYDNKGLDGNSALPHFMLKH